MELWLYLSLLVISLILIALSFYRTEHAELGIVGFTFIFLLSFVMIGGDIQYKVGTNTTYEYDCFDTCGIGNNDTLMTTATEIDVYDTFSAGGTLSRTVGYWLAVLGVVGIIGVFVSLRTEGFMKPR